MFSLHSEFSKNGYLKANPKKDPTQEGEKGTEVAYSSPPRIVYGACGRPGMRVLCIHNSQTARYVFRRRRNRKGK